MRTVPVPLYHKYFVELSVNSTQYETVFFLYHPFKHVIEIVAIYAHFSMELRKYSDLYSSENYAMGYYCKNVQKMNYKCGK